MKKIISALCAVIFLFAMGTSALAAGTDDGSLSVADKGGKKFFGTEVVTGCTEYVAADGSGEIFYDLTEDKTMNICDLVALVSGSVDLDQSGSYDGADSAALRLILIGAN